MAQHILIFNAVGNGPISIHYPCSDYPLSPYGFFFSYFTWIPFFNLLRFPRIQHVLGYHHQAFITIIACFSRCCISRSLNENLPDLLSLSSLMIGKGKIQCWELNISMQASQNQGLFWRPEAHNLFFSLVSKCWELIILNRENTIILHERETVC